jgi:hypothetical protein
MDPLERGGLAAADMAPTTDVANAAAATITDALRSTSNPLSGADRVSETRGTLAPGDERTVRHL